MECCIYPASELGNLHSVTSALHAPFFSDLIHKMDMDNTYIVFLCDSLKIAQHRTRLDMLRAYHGGWDAAEAHVQPAHSNRANTGSYLCLGFLDVLISVGLFVVSRIGQGLIHDKQVREHWSTTSDLLNFLILRRISVHSSGWFWTWNPVAVSSRSSWDSERTPLHLTSL